MSLIHAIVWFLIRLLLSKEFSKAVMRRQPSLDPVREKVIDVSSHYFLLFNFALVLLALSHLDVY